MDEDDFHCDRVNQPSDQELIDRANAGEASAFEALYLRYRDWVTHLAMRFTSSDRDLALDVMQDTFLQLLRQFPGFVLTAQLKTYLYPVVRHTALAMARKQRRENEVAVSADPIALNSTPSDALDQLRRATECLDPPHREVILLRFADDLSLQEVALAMEIPLGTVKSRLHHALAILRADEHLRDFYRNP